MKGAAPSETSERKPRGRAPHGLSSFIRVKLQDSSLSFMDTGFPQRAFPYKINLRKGEAPRTSCTISSATSREEFKANSL